jgi:hypothetical protein
VGNHALALILKCSWSYCHQRWSYAILVRISVILRTSEWICGSADMRLLSHMTLKTLQTAIKNRDCSIADMQLRSNIYLKSCGYTVAEVLTSGCVIVIADIKSCTCLYSDCNIINLLQYSALVVLLYRHPREVNISLFSQAFAADK